jgi:hypothetical protein
MPDTQKYLNTPHLGIADGNKFGLKLGDIVHIAGSYCTANGYNYCGYEPFDIPAGARARIIGIDQTDLNAAHSDSGVGDVYVDYELVDYTNADGTPITCGNRHAACFAETSLDFAFCPDGSGEPGYLRREGMRDAGLWVSLEATQIEDHPVHGYVQFRHRKVVDPKQYSGPGGMTMHEYLTVASCD